MQKTTHKIPALLAAAALTIANLTSALAQTTANWIGASGGEWNTGANWDTGSAPADSTVSALIGSTFTVNYNLPMAATSFGTLTENGVLNINTNGFNSGPVVMVYPGGTGKMFINAGGAVSVTGNMGLSSNSIVNMNVGSSLTVSGTLYVGSGSTGGSGSGTPLSLAVFTNNSGYLNLGGLSLNGPNASVGNGTANLVVINGGTNNLGNVYVGRASGSTLMALDREGLVLNGGLVNMASLLIGNNSWGLVQVKPGLVVTNAGNFTMKNSTSGRPARFYQSGGLFVNASSNAVLMSPSGTTGDTTYSVTGGTNIIAGIQLGSYTTNYTTVTNVVDDVTNITVTATNYIGVAGVVYFTNSAVIYVGAQGIASNGAATISASLNSGGRFVSRADWTNTAPITLNGGVFDAQDDTGTPHNIYSSGVLRGTGSLLKSGPGRMTLNAANTYSGSTIISNGTLALDVNGSLASPFIVVGTNTTFDVSVVSGGYVLPSGKTLNGFGIVSGAASVASGGIIDPGTSGAPGALNFSGSVTETGGAKNHFDLSTNPSGPNNDLVVIGGDFNVSGSSNIVEISGGGVSGSIHPLFKYSGAFNGSLSSFAVSGPSGTLTNITSSTPPMIAFVVASSVRGPTNAVWVGNAATNDWDTQNLTNWLASGALSFFVSGDNVIFDNTGLANPVVNIPGTVFPASVTVAAAGDYVLSGAGGIGGAGGITKTNAGRLTILSTNQFLGGVTIAAGTISVQSLADEGTPSPLGQSGTILLDGGTLDYSGPNYAWSRSVTLGSAGGVIAITNSAVTLTENGAWSGSGGLTKTGNGTLILNAANGYAGPTTLNSGTLTLNNVNGASSGNINLNGGTLALGAVKPANVITVNSNSVIRGGNTGGLTGVNNVTGSGNLLLAVTTSTGVFDLGGDMTAYSGTITLTNVGGASVRFNGTTGSDLATWDLGTTTMDLMIRSGSTVNRLGGLKGSGGTSLSGRGGASNNGPTTYLIGANNQDTAFSGIIQNGTGGGSSTTSLAKVGTGTLTLAGSTYPVVGFDEDYNLVTNNVYTNMLKYTGTTVVSNGVLLISGAAALVNSASVTLAAPSAVLDYSQKGDPDGTGTNIIVTGLFEVPASQTLAGLGTIRGSLTTDLGSTFNVGLAGVTGTLAVTNAVTLNGTTTMKLNRGSSPNSDRVTGASITYGGTLIVTNIGSTLHVGDTFTLFSGSGLGAGSFSFQLPSDYGWDTSQLGVNGTITVTSAPTPPTPPTLGNVVISGNNLTLNATGGTPNGPVSVLSSTNVALPLAQWTVVTTGNFDNSGNYNYTVTGGYSAGTPQQFYILLAQ